MRCLLCLVFFCASLTWGLAEDSLNDEIQRVKDLAHNLNSNQENYDAIDAIGSLTNQSRYDEALQQTTDLLKQSLAPELKTALEKFVSDLRLQRDQRAKEREDKTAALMAKIADVSWKARTSADLTAVTNELQAFENGVLANVVNFNPFGQGSSPEQFLNAWSQYLRARETGDTRAELQNLKNVQDNEAFNPITSLFPKDGLAGLRAQIREHLAKAVTDQLDRIPAQVAQAKTSQDLATISSKLDSLRNQSEADFIGVSAANRFNRDQNALNNWIGMLSAEETGDFDQALKSFGSFLEDPGDIASPELISAKRSNLFLEEINQPAKKLTSASIEAFSKKLDAVKNPEDLDVFVANLEALHQAGFQNNEADLLPLENDLASLARQWRYLNESRFDGFWNFESDLATHPWKDKTAAIRTQLAIQALHQQFGVVGDAASTHTIPEAFDSALKETIAHGDWQKTEQILLTMNRYLITTGGNTDLQAETLQAVRSYLEGSNSEQAGQWTDAIKAYRQVVSRDGPYVPRRAALDHLSKLLQEHPDAIPKP